MIVTTKVGLQFIIRPGTTDEKVVPEVIDHHVYTTKTFMLGEPGGVWLDAGANIGTFACFAARAGMDVIAYEPEPENFEMLRSNVTLNGYGERVRCCQSAIGAAHGSADLYYASRDRNKYRHSIVMKSKTRTHKLDVHVDSLWEVLARWNVTGVKLDIEGSELAIFDAPAQNWQHVGRLVFEYHFDADRSIPRFRERMARLGEHFEVEPVKLPDAETYDFFPAAKIVRCRRRAATP